MPDDGRRARGILLFQSWLVHGEAGENISRFMRNRSDVRDTVSTPLFTEVLAFEQVGEVGEGREG